MTSENGKQARVTTPETPALKSAGKGTKDQAHAHGKKGDPAQGAIAHTHRPPEEMLATAVCSQFRRGAIPGNSILFNGTRRTDATPAITPPMPSHMAQKTSQKG